MTIGGFPCATTRGTMPPMMKANWPASGRAGTSTRVPDAVRRRVDAAMLIAQRRTARVAVPLLAVGLTADAIHLVMRFGPAATPAALRELGVIAVTFGLAWYADRRARRPEPPLLGILVATFVVTLANSRELPALATVTDAYLAVILVGSALFLPWSAGWHRTWLGIALLLGGISFATAYQVPGQGANAASQLMAITIGAMAAAVGHSVVAGGSRRLLENQFELRRLSRVARSHERRVAELNRELVRTARLDTVTGIGNRRALDEALAGLAGQRVAAILLDLDHFKSYNDRNGHLAGDAALARVGVILRDLVRGSDIVFRYGGEEFLILLPHGDAETAARVAERVRQAIRSDAVVGMAGLTVSAGVAVADRFASSPLPLLRRADAALYQAKRAGRDRVVVDGHAMATSGSQGSMAS